MIWRGLSISFRHCSTSQSSDQPRRLAKALHWLIVTIGAESISWCKARVSGGNMVGIAGVTSFLWGGLEMPQREPGRRWGGEPETQCLRSLRRFPSCQATAAAY
jgi:hypothetical protein